jgi:hypothetical protein
MPLSPELTYAHEREMNNVHLHRAEILGAIFIRSVIERLESVGLVHRRRLGNDSQSWTTDTVV